MNTISLEDINSWDSRQRANIINSLSGYKSPLLLASGDEKNPNIGIFSNVFHIGSNPPHLGIFFRPAGEGIQRDSLKNILQYKHFTLNYISENQIELAHQSSARYPEQTSEFKELGLTPIFHQGIKAPTIKESKLSVVLELAEHIPVNVNNTSIVVGKIISIISSSPLITNDILELENFSNVAVKGIDTYYSVSKKARLSYAKPEKRPDHV